MSILVDIEKRLGDFSLKVKFEAENETLALLGASGCGKSMTLKCIAGVEKPDKGRISVDGLTLFDSENNINLPPQERHVGLMFQNYALFPNMTVLQNIMAGARRNTNREKRDGNAKQIIERFGLADLSSRYPHQLSGGQQQRVALARILVSSPNILLLDEPFSALDSHLRFSMEQEVRSVIRSFGKTVLLVSHDRDEVYRMADSIAIMNNGYIDALGKKKTVFERPVTKSGAMLTGCKNISKLEWIDTHCAYAVDWGIRLFMNKYADTATYVGIRMHDICPGNGENSVLCDVVEVIENPFSITVMLRPVGSESTVPLGWETQKKIWQKHRADKLYVSLPMNSLLLLVDDKKA